MNLIVFCVSTFLLILVTKSIYRLFRFDSIKKKYYACWETLDRDEQIELLYAEYGLLRKQALGEWQDADTRVGRETVKSFSDDFYSEQLINVENNCPQFQKLDRCERYKAFHSMLNKYWIAMKATMDYDFVSATAELDRIFADRSKLALSVPAFTQYKNDITSRVQAKAISS